MLFQLILIKELGSDLSQSLNEIALNIQQLRLSEKESKSLKAESVMIGRIFKHSTSFFIIGFMVTQNKEYLKPIYEQSTIN